MSESVFFNSLLTVFASLAIVSFIVLFVIPAPYGRHSRRGWGPEISNRWGWFLMEMPASLGFFVFYWIGDRRMAVVPVILLLVWQIHYVHRAFIYPFSLTGRRRMPVVIVLIAFIFNLANAYLQARWMYSLSPKADYSDALLKLPRFWLGLLIFAMGYLLAKRSDRILCRLKKAKDGDYSLPRERLFRRISCPNYLGEIIEWSGWALAVWSLPGLVFFLWTAANLIPRARSHHLWYKRTFRDYPLDRKALIPYIY